MAAKYGQLDLISDRIQSSEPWTAVAAGAGGWTPLHFAALYGHLDQVPADVFTEKNLTQKDRAGTDVVQYAAECRYLTQLPIVVAARYYQTISRSLSGEKYGDYLKQPKLAKWYLRAAKERLLLTARRP